MAALRGHPCVWGWQGSPWRFGWRISVCPGMCVPENLYSQGQRQVERPFYSEHLCVHRPPAGIRISGTLTWKGPAWCRLKTRVGLLLPHPVSPHPIYGSRRGGGAREAPRPRGPLIPLTQSSGGRKMEYLVPLVWGGPPGRAARHRRQGMGAEECVLPWPKGRSVPLQQFSR